MRSVAFDFRDALRSFRHDRAYIVAVMVTLVAGDNDASTASRRYQTRLFVAFGLAALFIAAVGVVAPIGFATSVFATRQGLAIEPARALREE